MCYIKRKLICRFPEISAHYQVLLDIKKINSVKIIVLG